MEGKKLNSRIHIDWQVGPDYRILRKIGEGSYGNVCEALHLPSGELVAIKHIMKIFNDLVDCKRLLREVCILRCLNHPNIVKIREILLPSNFADFNELYIVLEHAQSDLKKLVKSPLHLEHEHIKQIVYNILCGMNYMHSANILHRDLKLANILLNDDCEVKICDFGLSRSIPVTETPSNDEPIADRSSETRPLIHGNSHFKAGYVKRELSGHVVTRWYRAPELILLERNYNKAIDVWSVGCVIAELCEMLKENAPTFIDRSPLFPGTSCFPLSPDHRTMARRAGFPSSNSDQLNVIFNVIGTPSDEDISSVTDDKAVLYLRSFASRVKKSLAVLYPFTDHEIIELMEDMLYFQPAKRTDFKRALSHAYFDEIRDESKERDADLPPNFSFERIESISEGTLRLLFIDEILIYHENSVS